ncbi:MAG: hypothetical protein N4A33_03730 [Bacteriovoracaceae bacterium]|nr:hypothetical protein [Bacteriovoracaceae bacterium]
MENLINLSAAKKQLELTKKESQFKTYLKSLKREELQYEADFIMGQMGKDLNSESLRKSALLMEELASRVSDNTMSESINEFATNIREKISLNNITYH